MIRFPRRVVGDRCSTASGDANVRTRGLLHELATATGKRLVFYCAYGERSAMAVKTAQEAGLANSCHLKGGIDEWKKADGPLAGGGAP